MLDQIPLFVLLRQKMAWASMRQNVLAQNVSNSGTPGYEAKELEPFSFSESFEAAQSGTRSGMVTTHANHISSQDSVTGRFKYEKETPFWETTPDGNSVVLEEQMLKLSQNQADFQSAVNLYKKGLSLLRLALSSNN